MVSHLALNNGTLRHALNREFKPRWWQTLYWTQTQHLHTFSWFYLVDLIWYYYLSVKFVMWIVKPKIENNRNLFLDKHLILPNPRTHSAKFLPRLASAPGHFPQNFAKPFSAASPTRTKPSWPHCCQSSYRGHDNGDKPSRSRSLSCCVRKNIFKMSNGEWILAPSCGSSDLLSIKCNLKLNKLSKIPSEMCWVRECSLKRSSLPTIRLQRHLGGREVPQCDQILLFDTI